MKKLLIVMMMSLKKMLLLLLMMLVMMVMFTVTGGDDATDDGSARISGLQVHITPKGLQYGVKVGRRLLESRAKLISVAPVSGSTSLAMGKVVYVISGLAVLDVKVPAGQVTPRPGVGLDLQLGHIVATVRGDWFASHKIASDRGSFELTVSGLAVSVSVSVRRGAAGRPALLCTACSVSIDTTDIRFFGNGSWLYNLFNNFIEMFINSRMKGEICPHLKAFIDNDVNNAIGELQVTVPVLGSSLTLDYSLTRDPDIRSDGIRLYLKGEVAGQPAWVPGPPSRPPSAGSRRVPGEAYRGAMLAVGLSESLLNGVASALFRDGVLGYNVTDLPTRDNASFPLDTRSLEYYLPEVFRSLPGVPLSVLLRATSAPSVSVTSQGLSVSWAVGAALLARPPPPSAPLTVLSLTLEGRLEDNSHAVLINSVKDHLTERLSAGVPVPPVGTVSFSNLNVTTATSFVVATADVDVDIG